MRKLIERIQKDYPYICADTAAAANRLRKAGLTENKWRNYSYLFIKWCEINNPTTYWERMSADDYTQAFAIEDEMAQQNHSFMVLFQCMRFIWDFNYDLGGQGHLISIIEKDLYYLIYKRVEAWVVLYNDERHTEKELFLKTYSFYITNRAQDHITTKKIKRSHCFSHYQLALNEQLKTIVKKVLKKVPLETKGSAIAAGDKLHLTYITYRKFTNEMYLQPGVSVLTSALEAAIPNYLSLEGFSHLKNQFLTFTISTDYERILSLRKIIVDFFEAIENIKNDWTLFALLIQAAIIYNKLLDKSSQKPAPEEHAEFLYYLFYNTAIFLPRFGVCKIAKLFLFAEALNQISETIESNDQISRASDQKTPFVMAKMFSATLYAFICMYEDVNGQDVEKTSQQLMIAGANPYYEPSLNATVKQLYYVVAVRKAFYYRCDLLPCESCSYLPNVEDKRLTDTTLCDLNLPIGFINDIHRQLHSQNIMQAVLKFNSNDWRYYLFAETFDKLNSYNPGMAADVLKRVYDIYVELIHANFEGFRIGEPLIESFIAASKLVQPGDFSHDNLESQLPAIADYLQEFMRQRHSTVDDDIKITFFKMFLDVELSQPKELVSKYFRENGLEELDVNKYIGPIMFLVETMGVGIAESMLHAIWVFLHPQDPPQNHRLMHNFQVAYKSMCEEPKTPPLARAAAHMPGLSPTRAAIMRARRELAEKKEAMDTPPPAASQPRPPEVARSASRRRLFFDETSL